MTFKHAFQALAMGRRKFVVLAGLTLPALFFGAGKGRAAPLDEDTALLSESELPLQYTNLPDGPWWAPTPNMDAMTAIRTRRSVRAFRRRAVEEDVLRQIIAAGTSAPSANNEQPWHFVIIREAALLRQISKVSSGTVYVADAPAAILVCGENRYETWVNDTSACAQNMLLAAHALGLGAVWTGAFPEQERVDAYREMFKLPGNITPLCLIVVGYAQGLPEPENRMNEERVHDNVW